MYNIRQRIKSLVGKGILSLIQSSGEYVSVILGGETRRTIAIHPYGLRARPPKGATQIILFPNGNRSEGLCLFSVDAEGCPELTDQEACLYSAHDNHIHLKTDGSINIKGDINQEGSFVSEEDVSDMTGTMQAMREIFNTHTHTVVGASTLAPNQLME